MPFLADVICFSICEMEDIVNTLMKNGSKYGDTIEGIVIRTKSEFSEPKLNITKYVRKDHVQTDEHWTSKKIEKNIIKA